MVLHVLLPGFLLYLQLARLNIAEKDENRNMNFKIPTH